MLNLAKSRTLPGTRWANSLTQHVCFCVIILISTICLVCVSSVQLPEGLLMFFVCLEYCLLSVRDKEGVCICDYTTEEYSAMVHWFVFI